MLTLNHIMIDFYNGEQGIRTLEALVALTHFPGVLLRPTRTTLHDRI